MKRRPRRQRVALRVKLKRENGRRWLAVVLAGAAAAAAYKAASKADLRDLKSTAVSEALSYRSIEVAGVPPEVKEQMLALAGRPPAFGKEQELLERWGRAFPAWRPVSASRNVIERRWEVAWAPRTPLARLADGRAVDDEGRAFGAAAPLPASLPLAEAAAAGPEAWKGLAAILAAESKAGLPPVARAKPEAGGGWSLVLADGTSVAWGDAGRSAEKAARLSAVLQDARKRFPAVSADLRYFDDGKVLVRPVALPRGALKAALR